MRLITLREAAEILHCTEQRAAEMVRRRILPCEVVVRLGRQVRLREDRLMEWINRGGQALPAAGAAKLPD